MKIYGHMHKSEKSLWQRLYRKLLPKLYFRKILKSGSYIEKNEEFFRGFVKKGKDYEGRKSDTNRF